MKDKNVMMIKEYMNRSFEDIRDSNTLPKLPSIKVGKPTEESGYEA